ncbi:phosphodiester glycosidase family protein [Paenibacillus senegalensis]|uniref:phosphodiester glycosidase family protein n=1 Tax=Paenibacillus senegalensis TaxID=1465766 RepID=UPI0002899080|nr:phosphodiester glycosidase family protein [Paenibacillus senegalensis]
MRTKLNMVMLVFVSMVTAFFATFWFYNPLPASYAETSLALEQPKETLEQIRKDLTDIEDNYQAMDMATAISSGYLSESRQSLAALIASATSQSATDEAQRQVIEQLVADSQNHTKATEDALDQVLSSMLGDPVGQSFGERSTVKVFSLKEAGYSGYMAKVKLHDPNAVKLVLSNDKVGDTGETTSEAGQRKGAVLAINGGGFARQDGLLYPLGITVVDGEIKTFYSTDLSFIGFDKEGKLVGGDITTRQQIYDLNVMQGATFVPSLLKDGEKLPIPSKWKNKKEPRTLIGHFSNGDLLFIVIDGRQKGYSEGVTLEEAQDKLLEFKVRDAYTLDGGGSSAFYYNGKLLNSPSDGRERKLPTNFVVLP